MSSENNEWGAFRVGLIVGLFLGLSLAAVAVKYGVFIKL